MFELRAFTVRTAGLEFFLFLSGLASIPVLELVSCLRCRQYWRRWYDIKTYTGEAAIYFFS